MDKTYTITRAQILSFLASEMKLEALENGGVDNWEHYGDAISDYQRAWLEYWDFSIIDEDDIPEAIGKLRGIYPNIMKLTYDNTRTQATHLVADAEDVEHKTPLQLFCELYEQQNNQPMSQTQTDFVQSLIDSIREESL